MIRHFTLEYWKDEGWFVGRLKEIPGVFSQGETLAELEENIQEVYHLMLEDSTANFHPRGVKKVDIEVEV